MDYYLFLDFDGVMSSQRHRHELLAQRLPIKDELGPFFDPEAIGHLRTIIEATNARIIVSSTWKCMGLQTLQRLWEARGMPGMVIDVTPTVSSGYLFNRGMEVNQWLAWNAPASPAGSRFAILDDGQDFLPEQRAFLVNTNSVEGLSKEDAERVVAILLA